MKNETKPQPVINQPLSYDGKSDNMMVVKSNELIQKSRYDLTLIEQKIVLSIISLINQNDSELPLYEFSIKDFANLCGIDPTSGKNYANIKKRLKSLADKSFYVTLPGTETVTLVRWIDKPFIDRGKGTVKIKLDSDLKPFLLQLKNYFTQFNIAYTLAMKSQYSIRLYEIFKSYENMETVVLLLDELKKLLECEKYKQWTDFNRWVLQTALSEINTITDIRVSFVPIKNGRSIEKLKFTIKRIPEEERQKAIDAVNARLAPQKFSKEMAKAEAQIFKDMAEDETPSLPYMPSVSGTIEYAAGANSARMEAELKMRMEYDLLSKELKPGQIEALKTVIKVVCEMAGDTTKGTVINGGNKETFLLVNEVILKYSGMKKWAKAAAVKYDEVLQYESIKKPLAYLRKSIVNDLRFPELLLKESESIKNDTTYDILADNIGNVPTLK